jgi:hypothetical protein
MKAAKQDIPAAWAALDRIVKLSPPAIRPYNKLEGQMRIGIALARAGLADSARHVMESSRGDATVDAGRDLLQLEAIGRILVGDKDEAFKQFSAYLASNPQRLEGMDQDDSWEAKTLREDPRFAAIFKPHK